MTTIEYATRLVYPAALSLLPRHMDTPEARAMLTAIGLQESAFAARRQADDGPARGFWQFEPAGVRAVLNHRASQPHIVAALVTLGYSALADTSSRAIEHNDVLACVYARLLVWTHPQRLPRQGERAYAQEYYLWLWRPGRPRLDKWPANFERAWQLEGGGS